MQTEANPADAEFSNMVLKQGSGGLTKESPREAGDVDDSNSVFCRVCSRVYVWCVYGCDT